MVKVRVVEVDVPRKRVGLTMKSDGGASAKDQRERGPGPQKPVRGPMQSKGRRVGGTRLCGCAEEQVRALIGPLGSSASVSFWCSRRWTRRLTSWSATWVAAGQGADPLKISTVVLDLAEVGRRDRLP